MNNKSKPLIFVAIAILLRLSPHIPNVAPIGALALLLGSTLPKKYATLAIILTMVVTDYFLGFHNLILWVYGSYALICLIPKKFKDVGVTQQIFYSFSASLVFYLITNFGVWYATGMYEKTANGLLMSYWNAIPFFGNTLVGDFIYTVAFFKLYDYLLRETFAKKQAVTL